MYRTESTKRNSGAVIVGEWAWSVKEIEDELKTEYRPTTADLHQRLENGSAAAQTATLLRICRRRPPRISVLERW